MSNDANKGYQFTVLNGAVTAVYEIKNGRAKFEKMDRDETWSVDGANIVKTETEHSRIETTIYSDINGDGIFAKMSKSYGTASPVIANSSSLISGSDSDDQWRGNNSDDHHDSGHGNDFFKYTNVFESGLTISTRDNIHDFTSGDKLDLSAIDAKSGNWTNDAFTYVGAAANVTTANANGAVWFENGILYGSNDRDTAAEFQIQLVGVTDLLATDLIL
jgi:hypothetical protein